QIALRATPTNLQECQTTDNRACHTNFPAATRFVAVGRAPCVYRNSLPLVVRPRRRPDQWIRSVEWVERTARAHHGELQARGCFRAKLLVAVMPECSAPGRRYCSIGVITATPQSVPVMVVDIPHALA